MKTEMKLAQRFFGILLMAFILMACSKDGQDGEDGKDGADGETGSANVIYSEWIPSEIDEDPPFNSSSFKINTRLITPEIVQHGAILVYGKHYKNQDEFIFQLPITLHGRNTHYYYYTEEEDTIYIVAVSVDGISDYESRFLEEFRYVLIPGGVPSSGKSSLINYSKMTYEEIAKLFNIKD